MNENDKFIIDELKVESLFEEEKLKSDQLAAKLLLERLKADKVNAEEMINEDIENGYYEAKSKDSLVKELTEGIDSKIREQEAEVDRITKLIDRGADSDKKQKDLNNISKKQKEFEKEAEETELRLNQTLFNMKYFEYRYDENGKVVNGDEYKKLDEELKDLTDLKYALSVKRNKIAELKERLKTPSRDEQKAFDRINDILNRRDTEIEEAKANLEETDNSRYEAAAQYYGQTIQKEEENNAEIIDNKENAAAYFGEQSEDFIHIDPNDSIEDSGLGTVLASNIAEDKYMEDVYSDSSKEKEAVTEAAIKENFTPEPRKPVTKIKRASASLMEKLGKSKLKTLGIITVMATITAFVLTYGLPALGLGVAGAIGVEEIKKGFGK